MDIHGTSRGLPGFQTAAQISRGNEFQLSCWWTADDYRSVINDSKVMDNIYIFTFNFGGAKMGRQIHFPSISFSLNFISFLKQIDLINFCKLKLETNWLNLKKTRDVGSWTSGLRFSRRSLFPRIDVRMFRPIVTDSKANLQSFSRSIDWYGFHDQRKISDTWKNSRISENMSKRMCRWIALIHDAISGSLRVQCV